jgi:hypothetical protein
MKEKKKKLTKEQIEAMKEKKKKKAENRETIKK